MYSDDNWVEVKQAKREKRHELILSGPDISRRISESGLDENIFLVDTLNYLNINQTCLEVIPEDIGHLEHLTTLVLHSNQLSKLPAAIKKLNKLKVLDCSRNRLESISNDLLSLPQLTTVNFSSNSLSTFPSLAQNVKLTSIDLSNNKFETFPNVCYPELIHLAELKLNGNQIKEIPSSISVLLALKHLDLADNCITVVPGELADCEKLKELNLKGNKLTDKRLGKLVDQCRSKQVLDYVRQHCSKSANNSSTAGKGNKKGKKGQKNSESESTSQVDLCHKLRILRIADENPTIIITDHVKTVRPHIVACIVRNLAFTEDNFKKFIQIQTKLHEGICDKRNAATLATHDLDLIAAGNLIYTAMPPKEMKIKPLGRNKLYTAADLFQQLQLEADNLRREKKRNVYSGIHKYLYLIEGKPQFPCVMDASNQVISFPPITNSDGSKMSLTTKNMLIEVTSASSQQICRTILDQFLKELIILGIGDSQSSEENAGMHDLHVEQVKVVDIEGNLKHIYPSKTDLIFENNSVTVVRG